MHLHYSTERTNGKCPTCDGATALLLGSGYMDCDEESPFAELLSDAIDTGLEISCHWCDECRMVTAIAINRDDK